MVKRRTDGDFVRLALKRSLVREAGIVGLAVGDWVGTVSREGREILGNSSNTSRILKKVIGVI